MKTFSTIFTFVFLIAFLSSSIAQIPWTKDPNNPVMPGGTSGTWNRHVMMPNVLYNTDSSRYEMWYAATPGSPLRPYRIGFATSPDGISWTKVHPNPVLEPEIGTWDESSVEGQMVLRENGTYKMWYTGWSPTNDVGGIGYATSPDGLNWTKHPGNPVFIGTTKAWEEGGAAYCTIMPVTGGYKMWYTGINADWTESNIGYAESVDGIVWQSDTLNNLVLTNGTTGQWDNPVITDPQVVFIDSVYHMWYGGWQLTDHTRQIGWATSDDGIHWNKNSDPVLTPTSGQWDGNKIEPRTVMLEGDSLRMWYTGWNPPGIFLMQIGHATAPYDTSIKIVDSIDDYDNLNVPEGYSLSQNYPNPFNPSTTIEFTLPKTEFTTLKIFNILGKEVIELVANKLNQGNHTYQFNGKILASGVYYYQLAAGNFREVKKMILLR